jgi:membrane fusion protein (multidrug efflux system)
MRLFTKGRFTLLAIILILSLFIGWRLHVQANQTIPESLESVQAARGLPVETVVAKPGELSLWRTLAGTVEGLRQSPIVSTNTLEIVAVPHTEGDRVEAGDTVVLLAETAPNPMLHSLARSRALYDDAQRDVERLRNLFEEGAISRQDLDKAETQLQVALADLRSARDGVELKAPHDGILTSIVVRAGDMASAGKTLAWVAQTDTVRICFAAGSRQALSLKHGQRCRWEDPDTGTQLLGEITQLDLAADPQTHLLSGEAIFANPEGRFLPGLLITMSVRTGRSTDQPVLPISCLIQRDQKPHVFVVEGDTVQLVPVDMVLRSGDWAAVADLTPGAQVVSHGQSALTEGAKVWVVAGGEVRP